MMSRVRRILAPNHMKIEIAMLFMFLYDVKMSPVQRLHVQRCRQINLQHAECFHCMHRKQENLAGPHCLFVRNIARRPNNTVRWIVCVVSAM